MEEDKKAVNSLLRLLYDWFLAISCQFVNSISVVVAVVGVIMVLRCVAMTG